VAVQGNTRVMLLIRHGQYENRGGPGYGILTDVGREQAKMAGQHIVERMRIDPSFKKAMFKMTSSNLVRAVETADLIEREIVAELSWVDVAVNKLPADMELQLTGEWHMGYAELTVQQLAKPVEAEDKDNLLQPHVTVQQGSRIRVKCASPPPSTWKESVKLADVADGVKNISVYQSVAPVKRLPETYDEWECSGSGERNPTGDVHWSDKAETNGKGFSDACFASGSCPAILKLREEGDTFARVTEGTLCSPFRMPNDKNLNEADADTCSVLMKEDPLYPDYGELNSQILKDHAQADAGFYAHMYRTVDHKRVARKDRIDTLAFTFAPEDGKDKKTVHWTAAEFEKVVFDEGGKCAEILDEEGKKTVKGPFSLHTVGEKSMDGMQLQDLKEFVANKFRDKAKQRPGKQVEILVVHQNIIRYYFLKAMQFDTTAWLNFGGSNCTMTQLRITRRGDVICDFFGDHGSKMPVSHYMFNKHPDY
jgi:broad specificity phosphatase PhoE